MKHTTRIVGTSALIGACVIGALGLPASGQLVPEREYYGINRTIPMTVALPEGVAGEVQIALLTPVEAKEVAVAAAAEGSVDLAGLFPVLWTTTEPTVLYAQLRVDDRPVGPAVVLVPMVLRFPASINPATREPVFPRIDGVQGYSGVRAWVDQHVVLHTSMGDVEFRMRPDQAPNTVANFVDLVRGGYYTDIIFHRIIGKPTNLFVIQVGDPTGTGVGGPGECVDLEPSKLPHDFGVLSMARSGDPNSNGGQIFVCLSRQVTAALDNKYTSFAQAVTGADVIMKIAGVETDPSDRPLDPPVLRSAELVDAPPHGTGPTPVTAPSEGDR